MRCKIHTAGAIKRANSDNANDQLAQQTSEWRIVEGWKRLRSLKTKPELLSNGSNPEALAAIEPNPLDETRDI